MNEEVVTTTDNAGAGLKSPELPIKNNSLFKRIKELIKKNQNPRNIK
jgi:hypothetical protein